MPSILVATGFVRIESDTRPAMKALKGLGAIGAQALSTTLLPAATAAAAGIAAIGSAAATAGVALGAFGAAVQPQFAKITEANEKYQAAQEASTKADIAKAHAQKLAKNLGVEYGKSIKLTKDMTEDARAKAKEYNKALSEVGTSTNAARKSNEVYKAKLDAMTPATRSTANAFLKLKDEFEQWSDSLSGTTMPIFTRGLNVLRESLPRLTPIVKTAAGEITRFVNTLGEGAAGRIFKEFGTNVKTNAGGAIQNFLVFAKNMIAGVLGILNAFAPMQTQVTGGLAEMSVRFAEWSANLGSNQSFQEFIDMARGAAPSLGEIANAFGDIVSAAGPLAGVGLTVLTVFAQIVEAIPTPVLQLLVPAIIAVNLALKVYAVYQAAATAATWLFTTSVTGSNGVLYTNRVLLVAHRIALLAQAAATVVATAATAAFSLAMRVARGVMLAFRYALVAVRLAVVITTTAFRLLAIAMISNPIGLIIVALVALGAIFVLLWKRSSTFRNIVKGAMEGIKNAALAVARWFSGPFVDFFKKAWDLYYKIFVKPVLWFYTEAVPAAAKYLWEKVVQFWNLLVGGVKKAWDLYYKIVIAPVLWFYTKAIPAAAKFLWDKVVQFWNGMVGKLRELYGVIKQRVFEPIGRFFTSTIPGWAGTVRNKVRDAWNGLLDRLIGIYGSIRNRVFNPIKNFFTSTIPGWARTLRDKVKGFFAEMRDGVGRIWDGIKSKVKVPVNWVIRNVWNNGIRSLWGKITGWIGISNKLGRIKELASGGTVGRTPAGIFNRPTAIVGEGNPLYPEYVIPTDPKYATRARSLWTAAGAHFMEDGGVLGWIGDTAKKAGNAVVGGVKGIADFLGDPVGKAKKILLSSLSGIKSLGDSPWVKMIGRIPRMAIDELVKLVKDAAGSALGAVGLGPSGGSGVKRWSGVVQMALRMLGQPAAYLGLTLRRMNQESGGNPNIVNKWDSNWQRGTPSVGLMQVIGPTFRAYAGKYRKTGPFLYGVSVNPMANVYSSMRYALSRYGSLPRAYNRAGGYQNGTAGTSAGWHLFGEAGPELGFTPAGWRILNARQTAGRGMGTTVIERLVVENHGVIGSQREVENWLVETLTTLKRKGRAV